MTEAAERELERAASAGDQGSLRELIASMARRGMFFLCEECGALVPPQARDRHDYEHDYHRHLEAERDRIKEVNRKEWERYEKQDLEHSQDRSSSGMRVLRIPPIQPQSPYAAVACRPKNEPLFHRLVINEMSWSRGRVRFFHDLQNGQSNLHGGGSLPAASHFYAYGLSLVLDEGTDERYAQRIRNAGQVWFLLGGAVSRDEAPTYIHNDLPARAVINQRFFLASEVLADPDDELAGLVPMHRLSVQGLPVEINALECLAVDLILPREPVGPVGITCILHGLRLTGVTG